MAGVAGLEPVTSAVTGQRSNQLSYTPAKGRQTVREVPLLVNRQLGREWASPSPNEPCRPAGANQFV
jgi:hypothetical protein